MEKYSCLKAHKNPTGNNQRNLQKQADNLSMQILQSEHTDFTNIKFSMHNFSCNKDYVEENFKVHSNKHPKNKS